MADTEKPPEAGQPRRHGDPKPASEGRRNPDASDRAEFSGTSLGDMPPAEFRRWGYRVIDWLADYQAHPERHRIQPDARPGALADLLPESAPEHGESMERLLADFERQILPFVTHWNHPGFMGYFAVSGSGPGVLAETLAAGLNNIGLLWETSPALTELEQVTLRWLAEWLGIPTDWFAMTLGGASVASLHAVIAAREAALREDGKALAPGDHSRLVLYTSEHAHSSIEKTMLTLGLPRENCRKIPVDAEFRMRPEALAQSIRQDQAAGKHPFCVVATVGTTATTSIDPVPAIADIAARHKLWLHVDAAYAGAAAILPEKRHVLEGCERADSFLINPHKWLFAPMELTAFYTRRPDDLRRALSLVPEYLRGQGDPRATNFMEYSVPLGRRFRALKLWFVMRYFGREGIAANLREHMRLAGEFANWIDEHADFERVAPVPFSLVCFRYRPKSTPPGELDALNRKLLQEINATGELFLSGTVLNGGFVLRASISNLRTTQKQVERLWELLRQKASS